MSTWNHENLARFAEATASFAASLRGLSATFRTAGRKMALIGKTPKDRRRLERDWARIDRRPSLIHKGSES